ncbi:VOC family protein [Shewanella sp. UCD-KL21]|uniref:VOC family protein n=1 Tax=Shewanella sp. UCD-KL21 TaxID=1917164 RepID=UPI000970FBAD|nr:VOC family protein [Shewanella sp. UCD-KL21]
MRLNQVTLTVDNMTKACEFYLTLGFTQIVNTAHYARFMCPDGEASFSLTLAEQQSNKSDNRTVIYFEHEQLDEWVNQLIKKGIEFETLPTDQDYLWREARLFDPAGNKIKLYWAGENRLNPPWRVTIRDK